MQVHQLKLSSFRLYEEKQIQLEPGINLIQGPNAKGKTTLLEAIYLLIAGRSFRTTQSKDLIREGADAFRVEIDFEKSGVDQFLKMAVQRDERLIQHNRTTIQRLSALLGILQGVLLAPHDLELIKGPPQERRQYLDLQIAQVDPLYVHHSLRYAKSLKQRNFMLKTGQIKAIHAFEETMAHSAAYIMQQRKLVVENLHLLCSRYYQEISGKKESISLHYAPAWQNISSTQEIMQKLQLQRVKEIELGHTQSGPHRDELKMEINHKEAKVFGSEGEMRTLAAALRLAEWDRMREVAGEEPLLLVDDFGMNLDTNRLENMKKIFSSLGQVVITNASDYLKFNNKFNIIFI